MKPLSLLCASAIALTVVPSTTPAVEAILLNDAYTRSDYPNNTYGSAIEMRVYKSGAVTFRAFMKFDLATLPDRTIASQIQRATLRLWVDPSTTAFGLVNIHALTGPWVEKTTETGSTGLSPITHNNSQGIIGALEGPDVPGIAVDNEFVVLDITPLVKQWVSGAKPNHGICIAPGSTATVNLFFDTKEATATSHQPKLEITLAPARVPQRGDVSMGGFTNGPTP